MYGSGLCDRTEKAILERKSDMKKLLALVLVAALLTPMTVSVLATNDTPSTVVFNDEFNFQYVERIDEDNRIIRTYEKEDKPMGAIAYGLRSLNSEENDRERTKALLSDLGMGDDFIAELSDEDLDVYGESKSITGVVSYIKTDKDGNSTYVSEGDVSVCAPPSIEEDVIIKDDGGGGSSFFTAEYEDSYMRLNYMVIDCAGEVYKFLINAEWLTMPFWRLTDSLGACSSSMTVEAGTRRGWYSYKEKIATTFEYEENIIQTDFSSSQFQQAQGANGWYGSGVVFDLPADYSYVDRDDDGDVIYSSETSYSNFKIHYEFEGKIIYPDQTVNFNSVATYCHEIIGLSLSTGLSIGTSEVGVSIGLGFDYLYDVRRAEIPHSIQYKPE